MSKPISGAAASQGARLGPHCLLVQEASAAYYTDALTQATWHSVIVLLRLCIRDCEEDWGRSTSGVC